MFEMLVKLMFKSLMFKYPFQRFIPSPRSYGHEGLGRSEAKALLLLNS